MIDGGLHIRVGFDIPAIVERDPGIFKEHRVRANADSKYRQIGIHMSAGSRLRTDVPVDRGKGFYSVVQNELNAVFAKLLFADHADLGVQRGHNVRRGFH